MTRSKAISLFVAAFVAHHCFTISCIDREDKIPRHRARRRESQHNVSFAQQSTSSKQEKTKQTRIPSPHHTNARGQQPPDHRHSCWGWTRSGQCGVDHHGASVCHLISSRNLRSAQQPIDAATKTPWPIVYYHGWIQGCVNQSTRSSRFPCVLDAHFPLRWRISRR